MDFRSFLFVCTSYKASFLNRWDNTWLHLRLHILSPFPPSRDIFPLLNDCTDLTVHTVTCVSASPTRMLTWDRLLEDSPRISSSLPDRVCVCVCVCVYRRVVTYSGHFRLCYIHDLCSLFTWDLLLWRSQRASSSPPTHVCVFLCLSTRVSLHLPDISIFAIATHSFSHICTLSNTHFCSCFHCHYYEVPFPYIWK